jgi:hypothetical protein
MNELPLEQELRELVQRHQVCFDVLNEYTYIDHVRQQIGFCLELIGTHREGVEHPEPGCEHCRDVYHALERIASWITPKEVRQSEYKIEPFDSAIRYEPAHKNRPEVLLRIRILHRDEWSAPVDACEVQCLSEMKASLTRIGAQSGSWSSLRRTG